MTAMNGIPMRRKNQQAGDRKLRGFDEFSGNASRMRWQVTNERKAKC